MTSRKLIHVVYIVISLPNLPDMEQVVPDSVQEIGATGGMKVNYATNQDGVKLFELFTGDDIFAHHEE